MIATMEKQVVFNIKNEKIFGLLHTPNKAGKSPLLIISHGFAGDKTGPYPYLFVSAARFFAKNGWAVLRFDFRGNGDSEGAFEEQNIDSQLEDLQAIVKSLEEFSEIDSSRIVLLGHSRGGAVSLIQASKDKKIKGLITWATPANWNDIWGEVAEEIKKKGFIYFSNLKETKQLVETDFKYNPLTNWAKEVKQPWLIIHGEKDGETVGSVPISHAKELHRFSPNSNLKIIKKADHYFFEKEVREELFETTLNFLNDLI